MNKAPIPKTKKVVTILHKDGDTADIVKSLLLVANMDYQAGQVSEFAQRFKGSNATDQYEKLKELWRFTRREIRYEEDPKGQQLIKDPARVYHDSLKGDGTDCKSLSLFEYSVCRAIGIPCYFEFVSFFSKHEDPGQRYTHVYPVAIVPGIGEVVLDAVHTRFDERPPYITRVGKKYTKVFSSMTEIAHIANIRKDVPPTAQDLRSEASERAKLVKPLSFVDYSIMTEGEMTTFLLAQQAKLYAEFYQGTPQGNAAAADYLKRRDALYNGLHRGYNILPGVKTKTRSASGWLTMQERGIDLRKGFNAMFEDAENGAARVGATIPQLDCNALFPFFEPADADWKVTYNSSQGDKRQKCATENLWREALNADWPQNGPVLIYEFLGNAPGGLSASAYENLVKKKTRHVDYVDAFTKASKISRTNMRTWLQNGCVYYSIVGANGQSLGPQLPTDYINVLRQSGQEAVGAFPLVAIGIGLAVMALNYKGVKRLLGVVKGKQSLKAAIEAQAGDIQSLIDKYASDVANLAGKEDWQLPGAGSPDTPPVPDGGGGGTGSGFFANLSDNEKLGLAAAAVAVLVVASRK